MRRRGNQPRSTVTISDVARRVGVATSTVSRALTRPGRVSEELRQKVVAAASELGYYPNPQARSLTSGRTGCVALLVPDVTNPYFCGLIRGTQTQLRARGYRHLLVDIENNDEIEVAALAELPSSVDGLVVMGAHVSDERLVEVSRRVPIVIINREVEGVPSVVVDTADGARRSPPVPRFAGAYEDRLCSWSESFVVKQDAMERDRGSVRAAWGHLFPHRPFLAR